MIEENSTFYSVINSVDDVRKISKDYDYLVDKTLDIIVRLTHGRADCICRRGLSEYLSYNNI